ncbi:LysR family transcriptional regulator [Ralstonia solanacearum]|uniref:LysR family transcriptional regulator n=2 Tax=Ralstonia solanacearum TaxID=305 RepID=UPI0007C940DB|nr:LysR family transcriptional regulator [Ralstonia solanacearum]OAI76225.1 LysR family transcriptional regulator [Ralstonia solanacearum]RCW12314.1 LysR family transcriptional regulator [Ralstonia solanacearum]
MAQPDIAELTAFIAIAEQRSFRAAARLLGLSPSALSHSIRGLEERLNARLFNRTTRSVALTEAGEQFFRRVQPLIADLKEAVDDISTSRNRPSGAIRISAAEASARPLVQHVLPDFLEAYPDIHVEMVVDTRFVDIVADGFDVGVRLLEDVPRDMIAIRFGPDMRLVAVASPTYLARHEPPTTPQELADHRCIRFRFTSGRLYRWNFVRGAASYDIDVNGPMTLGNPALMVDAALAGVGIAWVPDYYVAHHLEAGRLIHLLPEWSLSVPGASLYYPANRHPPTALRLFTQAVREWASGQ